MRIHTERPQKTILNHRIPGWNIKTETLWLAIPDLSLLHPHLLLLKIIIDITWFLLIRHYYRFTIPKTFVCILGYLLLCYPLMAPIIIPFTKYFCRNGYTVKMGTMVTMITDTFTASEITLSWLSVASTICFTTALLSIDISSWINNLRRRIWMGIWPDFKFWEVRYL